jgi:hypothetical protein
MKTKVASPKNCLKTFCVGQYHWQGSDMVRGTGKVYPSKFEPSQSTATPLEEFPNRDRHNDVFR